MKMLALAVVFGLVGLTPLSAAPHQNYRSAFMNALKPGEVVRSFYDIPKTCTWNRSMTAVGDPRAPREFRFRTDCAIRTMRETELIQAMKEEIKQRLKETHTASEDLRESATSFECTYRSGKTVGAASLSMTADTSIDKPLPEGYEVVHLTINLDERTTE